MPGRKTTPARSIIAGLSLALLLGAPAFAGDGKDQGKDDQPAFEQTGRASWYGPGFHGKKTASGERFDQNDLTAAHRTLPLGSEVTVKNPENGREVDVEINDRGPYVKGRVIDLSSKAADKLGIKDDGTARVKIEATEEQLAAAKKDDDKQTAENTER